MTKVARLLQLDNLTWSTVAFQELPGRMITVFFAYAIMAWNRFGLLSFTAPRAPARLVLIGIYSWMALAVVVWLAGWRSPGGSPRATEAAIAAAIVHVPMVALAFFIAIVAGFGRILGPGTVMAAVVVGIWMPALLTRALHDVAGLKWMHAVAGAALAQSAWIAVTGRYLHDNVGHLL